MMTRPDIPYIKKRKKEKKSVHIIKGRRRIKLKLMVIVCMYVCYHKEKIEKKKGILWTKRFEFNGKKISRNTIWVRNEKKKKENACIGQREIRPGGGCS